MIHVQVIRIVDLLTDISKYTCNTFAIIYINIYKIQVPWTVPGSKVLVFPCHVASDWF